MLPIANSIKDYKSIRYGQYNESGEHIIFVYNRKTYLPVTKFLEFVAKRKVNLLLM